MDKKVLVAYATRCGSTAEVAAAIASELKNREYQADIHPLKEVSNLSGYNAIVVGSAIRFNQWLPDAVAFVRRFQSEIAAMPSAFFAVHILNTGQDQASQSTCRSYLDPVRIIVQPAEEAFFAGKVDLHKLTFVERWMAKAFKSPTDDQRNWASIRTWGQTIFSSLR